MSSLSHLDWHNKRGISISSVLTRSPQPKKTDQLRRSKLKSKKGSYKKLQQREEAQKDERSRASADKVRADLAASMPATSGVKPVKKKRKATP